MPIPRGAKRAKGDDGSDRRQKGFTDEERSAMKDRIKEMREGEADGEVAVLAKIGQMPEPDRSMGKRLHAVIMASVPTLAPRLWYGMPAYAKDDKVVCHFQPASKFKTRYATLGFSDKASLDEGAMWPNAYALKELTPVEEARIAGLVKRAAG